MPGGAWGKQVPMQRCRAFRDAVLSESARVEVGSEFKTTQLSQRSVCER
jgi:hypothetical protein